MAAFSGAAATAKRLLENCFHEDAPTGVEESAARAVAAAPERAAMSLLERLQAIRIIYGSHHHDSISASVSFAK